MTSTFELRPGFRQRTNCSYWDFFVDGKRLAELFDIGDYIPPLGWLNSKSEQRFVEMFLRKSAGDLPNQRIPLFVCAECADYGCGVFSCKIERTAAGIEWREFGMQNDYEVGIRNLDTSTVLTFDPTQYYSAFRSRLVAANG